MMEQGYTTMSAPRVSDNVFLNTNGQLATYSNQVSNHYLTPTSPITLEPPQILPSRAANSFQRKQPDSEPIQRVDSGIDTDSQRSPTPSTSTVNPRNSAAVYEYIHPKDVYLEPSSQFKTRPGESASSGTTVSARSIADVTSDSEDGGAAGESNRRRFNPMYEALENSATRLYARTCQCKVQTTTQKQLRYLWSAFIVVLIITIFLLGVLAYILFFLIPGIQSHVSAQGDRIKYLESGFLYHTQDEMPDQEAEKLNLTAAAEAVDEAGAVLSVITELNATVNTLSSQLMAVNASLRDQLTNISLTPGPQGPPGAGDLNECFYLNRSSNQALPGFYSTTSWQPSVEALEDNIVMSAACGVIGGTIQFVETKVHSSNKVQFRCRCDGEMSGYTHRNCNLHLIICPRNT